MKALKRRPKAKKQDLFQMRVAIPAAAWCHSPPGFPEFSARVAELVDALDSGSSTRKGVQVRVLSRAPYLLSIGSDSERARNFLLIYPHLAIFWPLFRSAVFFQPGRQECFGVV